MKEVNKYVVVSYVPLMNYQIDYPIQLFDGTEDPEQVSKRFSSMIQNTEEVRIEACIWVANPDRTEYCPVLLTKNAAQLYDHMWSWSENKPEKWFRVIAQKVNEERYIVVVQPNIEESVKRFKVSYLHHTGNLVNDDAEFVLIFQALQFISEGSVAFDQIKDELTYPMTVGLLDIDDLGDFQRFPVENYDKIMFLGALDGIDPDDAYLKKIREDMLDGE